MEHKIQNLDEKWWEHKAFPQGYGHFPYFILKVGHAMYMQIPIHFNTNGDYNTYPGTHINEISEEELNMYSAIPNEALHKKLIEQGSWIKNKIETDRQKPCRLCLVEGPETAYYFDENTISFNQSIPSGGTLLTQQNKVIAMNSKHYII